ncbi:MAG: hypothetical protein DRP45_05255 [Candidatus Zixiibacteriota bacterium]|nr:MAG: hypothetical protein DRP45_05255 [candidate division Zixibacteria bacterium]
MKKTILALLFGLVLLLATNTVLADEQRGCCANATGNVDCDPTDAVDGADLSVLIDHLFISLDDLCCVNEASMDGLPGVDGADLSILINHLFINLTPLPLCHDAPPPSGEYLGDTGCKPPEYSKDEPPATQDCLEYYYENGTLFIKHWNAVFNCCAIVWAAPYVSNNITIYVNESFEGAPCPCLCRYDLEFIIHNLPLGKYTIAVEEMYIMPDDDPVVCHIDLNNELSGICCEERLYYPWIE